MKILVTGRDGQVVTSLLEQSRARKDLHVIAVGRPDLDLEVPGSAERAVRAVSPDVVISAAAYTEVDRAEDEPDRAFRINGEAPGELAAAARKAGARIIHLSTDYVFDGTADEPYREDAPTNPLGVYGKSKLRGEERVREENIEHVIVRTAWIYSPHGRNFLKTMVALAEGRERISVVADQQGNPTAAADLVGAMLAIIDRWQDCSASKSPSIYHIAGAGDANWAMFAEQIFTICREVGLPSATIDPIMTAAWPTKARRPMNSRLDCSRFYKDYAFRMPNWRASVAATVRALRERRV